MLAQRRPDLKKKKKNLQLLCTYNCHASLGCFSCNTIQLYCLGLKDTWLTDDFIDRHRQQMRYMIDKIDR